MPAPPPAMPVVFVHGMWLHATVWEPWLELFAARGYRPIAPGWPGEADSAGQTRRERKALDGIGMARITDHYEAIIAELPATPVVIGHCFGGLVAQQLLARGFARAAVAITPAQFRGVLRLPRDQLRTAATVLSHPSWWRHTWMPTPDQFYHQVANTMSRTAADRTYTDYVIPAPTRPLLENGFANVTFSGATAVDVRAERGPLLLLGGGRDRTAPGQVVAAAYRRQAHNPATTDLAIFPERGHSMPLDDGWRDIARLVLDFLATNNLEHVA